MDLALNTAAPLPALKNTAHNRGRSCELQVRHFLENQGYKILGERIRVAGVEIDLLVSKNEGERLLVEVKSVNGLEWVETRLSKRQRHRLKTAATVLIERGYAVEIWLALVGRGKTPIEFITDL